MKRRTSSNVALGLAMLESLIFAGASHRKAPKVSEEEILRQEKENELKARKQTARDKEALAKAEAKRQRKALKKKQNENPGT